MLSNDIVQLHELATNILSVILQQVNKSISSIQVQSMISDKLVYVRTWENVRTAGNFELIRNSVPGSGT